MLTQLNPPIPVKTPKGKAWAVAIIDYGPQWNLCWVTFIEQTGECWTFANHNIRQEANYTFGLPQPSPIHAVSEEAKGALPQNGVMRDALILHQPNTKPM